MLVPSGKIDTDTQFGQGLEVFTQAKISNMAKQRSAFVRAAKVQPPSGVCFWEVLAVTRRKISPDSYHDSNRRPLTPDEQNDRSQSRWICARRSFVAIDARSTREAACILRITLPR